MASEVIVYCYCVKDMGSYGWPLVNDCYQLKITIAVDSGNPAEFSINKGSKFNLVKHFALITCSFCEDDFLPYFHFEIK